MKRIRTASIATLGCKLNQSESDHMARQLAEAGVALVEFGKPVDLCLVNSCTVTHVGDHKSRQLIRQAVRSNPGTFVAVAGCYVEMDPEAVRAIEGVGAVLGNRGKDRLVEVLRELGLEVGRDLTPLPPSPLGKGESSPPLVGEGLGERLTSRTRALVKIQEGCDNRCSYCIVPQARGHQRSRPCAEIVDEIRRLVAEGYQEVVLTGVNITAYGRDHGSSFSKETFKGAGLYALLERILAETEVARVRLSSLQPEDWTSRFYELWPSGRLCRHLHFSLQSGSDAVLREMRRCYKVGQYRRLVEEARRALPGVAITTDVIAGFPGEQEEQHRETEDFLTSLGFAALHVFKYSPRLGTAAAAMSGQVAPAVKQERSDRLIALGAAMGRQFRSQFVGSVLEVLWEEEVAGGEARRMGLAESREDSWWTGLSDNYVRVYTCSSKNRQGIISGAQVQSLVGDGVVGRTTR